MTLAIGSLYIDKLDDQYYLSTRAGGGPHVYFRDGEVVLFNSSPTYFPCEMSARFAACRMGFDVKGYSGKPWWFGNSDIPPSVIWPNPWKY